METLEKLLEKKKYFDERVTASILYLSEALKVEIHNTSELSPSWMTYGYYFSCLKKIEENDLVAAKSFLQKAIDSYHYKLSEIKVTFADKMFMKSEEHALIRSIYDRPDNNEAAYLFGAFSNDLEQEKKKIYKALSTIETHLPEYYQQLVNFIPNLLITGPTDTRFITSASTVKLFGCVIIGSYGTSSICTYLEDLIHELAHHRLFLEQAHDELIKNSPNEKYPAPFRSDLRPMAGLFHAHYVLGNIFKTFHTLSCLEEWKKNAEFQEMLSSAKRRFYHGKEIIDQHGQFTERGLNIYQTINKEVDLIVVSAT
ncbi:hypothetical protein EXT42_18615 [Pseudoalteromonas sp. CO302Y]|uniref:aKG-HExxH-type peptide beta-hydroxylase n=1 Tax=unclassified Pseudoalteromonas TaxID=194690 RepID=UPI001023B14F|nr:hypothetical protein EXT42_18615 [Pseudoalteromonas sp. CO302Y]RZG06257.1 hypothetical protein EXT40_18620 [Pseudoalteromonas sp. CO133X]